MPKILFRKVDMGNIGEYKMKEELKRSTDEKNP